MSLTTENIKFIDSYLENSEVVYADVRMEMVDHVASEVEALMRTNKATFYDAFKSYMVAHKKELLRTNKKFKWAAEKKVWGDLGKQFLKPQVFLFGFLMYLVLIQLQRTFDIRLYLTYLPIVLVFTSAIFYRIFLKKKKLRFSGIERTGAVFALIIQILIIPSWDSIFNFTANFHAPFIFNALVGAIIMAFIRIFQKYRKEYSTYSKLDFI